MGRLESNTVNHVDPRCGHTLIELVIAMTASAFLLAGLSSTIYMASRIASTTGPTAMTIGAGSTAHQLMDELRFATFLVARSDRMIEFVVSDRDGDAAADVIRYEWSGTAGDSLMCSFNHGTPVAVANDVYEFHLAYNVKNKDERIPTTVESSEQILASQTGGVSAADRSIEKNRWRGQYFTVRLPADATSWTVTRVELELRKKGTVDGEFLIQLRPATGTNTPTSSILEQVRVPESSLQSSYNWESYPISNVSGLAPKDGLCLVLEHVTGEESCEVRCQDTLLPLPSFGFLSSDDQSASWDFQPDEGLHLKIHGTYTTPGAPLTVTRKYLTGVNISLQLGASELSRVETSVHLLNSPELLSGYWTADFDRDPTQQDKNGDGVGDWIVRGGGNFDDGTLSSGIWHAGGTVLDTYPPNDSTGLITTEVRLRDTSVGENVVGFWVNAECSNGDFAPIYLFLQLQPDNTQTLSLYTELNAVRTPLVTLAGFTDGFVDVRLVVDPDADTVALFLFGWHEGTYQYILNAQMNNKRRGALLGLSDGSQFDFVSVRVSEPD